MAQDDGVSAAQDRNVFVLGGRYTDQYFENSLVPIVASYEDNYVLGAGYQQFFLGDKGGLRLGGEYGVALRGGTSTSAEVWGGVVVRADGLIETDAVKISAAATVGISAASGTLGIERDREIEEGGNSSVLFYFGPEISISSPSNPNMELFYRIHHRSGAWETLGDMRDGANATTVGVRWSF